GRTARLAYRDLDAERGPGVARPGADGIAGPARAGDRAAVRPHPGPVARRRRHERPFSKEADHPADPDDDDGAGVRAGPARLDRAGPVLARGRSRADLW